MHALFEFLLEITSGLGYWGIVILMAVESSFLPLPSEIVIPPAAYLAYKGEMSLFLVIIAGVVGSLIGALINYFLALWLGKPLIYKLVRSKWAKFIFLNKEKLQKVESYFIEHGAVSTFVGRLLPVVRHLISIPAGFVKMNLGKFCLFTTLGAALWVTILALLGYYFGAKQEVLEQYYGELTIILIAFVVVVGLAYFYVKKGKSKVI
ncbi:MAG: DedA family protein [Patescibacteria group bacterium]